MSHRHHEDFRGSRNVEGTGDQVSVQTNSKPNYIAKRAFGQTYNQLSSSNSQITSFENYSNASKQNTKSRIILKPYMNPGENITKVHTNIDIGEVLEDLRKQNSISGLKCLFTLLEDPTLGEQIFFYSLEVEDILHKCIYSNTNEPMLDHAFYCLTTLGIHISLYKQDYFESFINNLSEARNLKVYCRYIQALRTILERLCLFSQGEIYPKIDPKQKCKSICIYVPFLLRELQYQLEIVDQVDQMQVLVSCILVLAKNFPDQFSIYFIDWVDILIGWLVDITHCIIIRSFISDSLTAVKIQWSLEFDFSSKLLSNFCEDMERVKVGGTETDLAVPLQSELDNIYEKFHDEVGHPGINTTLHSVQQRYTWAGVSQDVKKYMTAALPPQPQKKLQPIPPPSKTWRHIGMDLICDLPESEEGYKHILVTVCYLSKYVAVRPLKTKTSQEVIQNLKDIYLDMGLPDIIQHDQGKEFTSNIFQEFNQKLGIDNRSTRAYHPMANGLVEAHNKILKQKLIKMESQIGDHWSKLLKQAVLAMNSCKKRSLGQTPFKVMWGRESPHQDLLSTINNLQTNDEEDFDLEESIFSEVTDPLDDIEGINDIFCPPPDNPLEAVSNIDESRTSTQQSAMDCINFEQLKQKIQFDKKVNTNRAPLKKDDKIIYTNMPKLKHMPKTKKQTKHLGPYTVSKVTESHVTISKTDLGTKKDKNIPIHITRPYFERSSSPKNTKKKVSLDTSIGINTSQMYQNLFGFSTVSIFQHLNNLKCYSLELSKYIYESRFTDYEERSFIARLFAFSTVYECVLVGNPDFDAFSSKSNSISLSLLRILSLSLDLSNYPEISKNLISFFVIILSTTKICLPIFTTQLISFIMLQFSIELNDSIAISLFNFLSVVIERTTNLSNELSICLIKCIFRYSVLFSNQQSRFSFLSKSIITLYQSIFKFQLSLLIKGLVDAVLKDLEETFSLITQFCDETKISYSFPVQSNLEGTLCQTNSGYRSQILKSYSLHSLNDTFVEDCVDSTLIIEKAKACSFHFDILSLFASISNLSLLPTFHQIYQFLSSVLQSLSYSICLKYPSFHYSAFHALYNISLRFEHFLLPSSTSTTTLHTSLNQQEPLNPSNNISFPLQYITLCEIFYIFQYLLKNFFLNFDLIQLLLRWFLEILEPVSSSLSSLNCNQLLNTTAILLLTLTYSREQSIRLDISKIFRRLIQENLLITETLRYCVPDFILRLCDSVGEIRASFSGLLEILPTHVLVSYSIRNMPTFLESNYLINSNFIINTPSAQLCRMIRRYFLLHSDKTVLMHEQFQAVMIFVLQGYASTKQSSEIWLGNLFTSCCTQQSLQHTYFDKNIITEITRNCDALLWYWVVYECALYCVSYKLQTYLGDPNTTFLSIESVLRKYISEVELRKDCEEYFIESSIVQSCSPGTGLGPRHYTIYLRGVLLLLFIEQLEKLMNSTYYGSFAMSAKCTSVKAFFQKNIDTCNQWFSRIRPAVMKMALHSALPTMTIRCGLLIEGPLEVTDNSFFLLVDALVTMKSYETLEGISISYQLGAEKWLQGAITEAQGNYENARKLYQLTLLLESAANNEILHDNRSVYVFSNEEVKLFCSKRLIQCYFSLENYDQLVEILEPTNNNTIPIGNSPFLLHSVELKIHFKQIMALSEFQDRSMHPLNNILNKVIPDFIQPHLLWTSKQQLHYSQTLLIRGLLPNKYHQNCTNVSEDEFEWSPDESDLPPATLGPARTDRTNISKWRRWLKQASAYAEAPLRVGALDWPISLMPYHVLQLQAIAAVRAAHPDKFRLSQPVGSAFTTVGSYIIKLNPHQHDLAIWNQVLLLSKNLAVLEEQSVSNIVLSVSRLARKQGNIKFAEKLLNTLISNITNLSNTSCFIESCKVLLKTLTNFQYSPPIEEKHIPIYYECSKLLFLKNELVTACDIILNSFSNYLIIIDNLSGITHEYISRMFITLSKWIQTDVSLFELVCNIKSEQSGLYSLLFIGNFMSHDFTWKDCITGLLQHVANEKYSSNLGKAWLKFANWNYKLGTKMHNSIDYDQNLILLSSEEDKILQLLPNYFSHEVKTTFINSFSKMVVQRNSNENQKLFIGDNAFVFNSIPNFIEIQELCSNYPCLKEINCDHKLLTIWYEVIERLFSPYIYSAQAYFTFLTKSFDNIKESDCIQATLRLHRLTENFFTEMRHTLKSGYYSTPIRVWKRIIPQVVNQLNNPKIGVRRIIQFLIYKMAEFWPYLLLYRAILSSPLSQNENIKDKIQCLSYIQNSKSLVTVLQKISKQNHKLVNSTRCLINEFQRISLLWDELWLACLTSVHKEFVNLLYLLDCELIKLSELYYLNLDCKKTLITAKYQLIMSPIFKLILLLMDTITLPPDTPYECTFQNNNSTFIFDSINDIRNPHEPYHQGHIIDKYRKLIDFFLSLQQKQLTEKVMKLSYLSPILSTMMHEEALLPAISTIDDKPIFLTNVCQDILIQPTKTRPKKLGMNASDGKLHYFLFKGLENLHLDERMMQMLGIVNCILNDSNSHPQGFFQTRHYRVTPLGAFSGIIEWVDNATPIFTLYKRWQLNSIPKSEMNTNLNTLSITPLKPSELFYLKLNPLLESLGISTKSNVSSTRKIWPKNVLKDVYLVLKNETPSNLISCELWFNSTCSSEWWIIQQSYCRSLAVMSITGYIIGLGDRHLDNILLDFATGEIIHVDYNVCFENGIKLRVPEMVPFRLTQNFRRALGPSDIEGNFKISCKKTMITYIKEKEILLNLLRTFVNDPLVNWANAKLIEQSLIFDLFTNMKNHANIISNERILSIEIMEHWPRWTHLYNNGIAISGTILKAINEYQTNLVQKNTNDELLIECGRQLSVISEIGNSTFNSYRVTLVEFKNHIDKKKSLVSSLNYKLEVLKSDQYTFGMKNYLTKIEVFHMFKILHNLSISEFLRDYNNLPLELLVSSIPDELKIEYSTLQSQLFNLMICSTNEIKDLLYLLDEHCDFAELNLSDVRSYWIDLLEIVSCEPTVGNMNLVLNEVNQYFIDQSLLIDKVTGGLSQLRLHLQNVELNLKSLEERTHELNFTSSSDLSGELETIFENIFLYVNDNDGANSRTVLNLIGASLPQKFEKWYWMERIAKNSGNNLCELVSEDGDWFLEELCTMSGNVYQMIKCGKLVLSHIKLPKFQTLKKLFKSIKYTNRLYCGLRDLYRNFQKDFMPLIIQIQQSNEFQHLKFHLDEIKGTSDLLSLIAEAEKIYQDVSSNNYNSEKSKIHSIADSMIDRYKQYLECLHFDLKIPTFQLILLIFDNYLKLSQIYEDYQILNWKEHALSLTFAMENFQRSQLLQTFVHPSKRQLFSELFFFKYLLMNYNIIQSAMNMMSILTEQTFNRSVFIISSESDLLLPLRRYLADFIIMRVLGSPTQVLLSVILSIMDCLGILPTFKMEESIINISKRGVENFFQIHPSPSNIGDISRTIASFDMTWRRKNMCKRVNSNIDITKFCLIRARDFLNVYCLNFVLLLEECPFKSKFCGWINKISKSGLGMLNKIQNLLLNKIQLLDSEFFQQISLIPNSSLLSSIFEKYINKRNVIVFELSSLIDRVAKYFSDTISFYKFRWISEEFIAFGIFLLNSLEELKLTVEIVKKFENEFLIPERCLLYLDLTITQDTTRSDVIYKLETEKKKLGCIGCNLEKKIMRGYSYINTSFDSLINLMKDFNELYLSVQEILVTLSHSIKTNEIWCRILKYFEYAIKIWCNISSTNLDTNDLEKIFDIIGAVQNILKWTVGYLLYFSARDLGMDITSMLECDFSNIPNLHNLNIFQERLVNKIRISLLQFPINENISNGNYLQYENKIKSDVWLRINNKFAGMESDSISEIVDGIINDALNVDNLSQMYEGWTSWV